MMDVVLIVFVVVVVARTGPRHILQRLSPFIDYFVSYRNDSDLYVPYGRIRRRDKPLAMHTPPPFANKTRTIVWMVSDCAPVSRRNRLAAEMAKHVDIDIYGACGNLTCAKSDTIACYRKFELKYKFYLSFENGLCRDYVTEKLFKIAQHDLVPIVYGAADYATIMPPHSYIDVRNFTSVRELVKYIKQIADDEQLYNAYFDWKRTFFSDTLIDTFCELCHFLVTRDRGVSDLQELRNQSLAQVLATDDAINDQTISDRQLDKWFTFGSKCKRGPSFFN